MLSSSLCCTFVSVNIYSLGDFVRGAISASLSSSHSTKVDTILLSTAQFLLVKNVLYEERRKLNECCVFVLLYKVTLFKVLSIVQRAERYSER